MSSGTPYIGSKISLVSKAEIRYEGFLYTIDQNDSTVTLAKVISLGTEDRVPGAGAVPAREEVFEYIVFRGSDIKDLHVCEGPKKVEDPAIVTHSYSQSYNPNYHRGPPSFPPQGGPGLNFGYNPFNIPQQNNIPVDLSQHPNSRQQTPPNLPRGEQRGNAPSKNAGSNFQDNRNKVKGNEGGGGNSGKYRDDGYAREHRESTGSKQGKDKESRREAQEGSNRDGTRDERGTRDNRSYRDNRDNRTRGGRTDRGDYERRDNQRSNRGDDSDDKDSGKNVRDNRYRENRRETRDSRYNRENNRNNRDNRDNRDNRYQRDNREQEDRDEQRSAGTEGHRGQPRGRGVGRGRGGGNRRGGGPRIGNGGNGNGGGVAPATRNKFTEDFDFETSNAKFNKEEIEKELLKVLKKVKIKDEDGTEEIKDIEGERESDERAPLPSPDKFYDRSKSFFDNILCEAMPPRNEEEVMTRRQEQALNTETFGSSAAHYRPAYRGRGRGRGRWRGGRGFRGGRGNFRGNSNRRWVDYEFDYEAAGIKSKSQPKVSEGETTPRNVPSIA